MKQVTITIDMRDLYTVAQLASGKPWGGIVAAAPAGFRAEGLLNAPELVFDQLADHQNMLQNPFIRSLAGEFGDLVAVGLPQAIKRAGGLLFEESIRYGIIGRADAGGGQLMALNKWDSEYFGEGRLAKNSPRIATFLRPVFGADTSDSLLVDRRHSIPRSQIVPADNSQKTEVVQWPLGLPGSGHHKQQFDYKHERTKAARYFLFGLSEYLRNLYFFVDQNHAKKLRACNADDVNSMVAATADRLAKIERSWGASTEVVDVQFCLDIKALLSHLLDYLGIGE
jgi:hypothetical protein